MVKAPVGYKHTVYGWTDYAFGQCLSKSSIHLEWESNAILTEDTIAQFAGTFADMAHAATTNEEVSGMWSSGIVIAGYRVPSTGNRVMCLNSYL